MQLITLDNLDKAKELIQQANISQLKEIIARADALKVYAAQAKRGLEIQNQVAEIKLRAEKRIGDELRKMPKNKGSQGKGVSLHDASTPTLKELGIEQTQSHRWQQVASLPDKEFEEHIAKVKASNEELTTVGIIDVARKLKKQTDRNELAEKGKDKKIEVDLRLGDFEDVFSDIPDNSVDCIITDPPYPIEFIDCWRRLGRFAKRVLKPHGFCIAYSGQMNLPIVINKMQENLDYYWTFAVYHEGQTQIVNGVNLICRWKPILIFQKGKQKIKHTIQDYFISEQREKGGHDWQQSKSGVAYLIENFTEVGDLVIDPFAGAGTTLIVAKEKGRNVKGAEIDKQTFNIAKANL